MLIETKQQIKTKTFPHLYIISSAIMLQKSQRNLLILAVGMFALSAVEFAEQGKTVLTTGMAIAAALNLLAFLLNRLFGSYAAALVNLANAMVSLFMAISLYSSGKQYLPYVWMGITVLYLVATVVGLIKAVREKNQ